MLFPPLLLKAFQAHVAESAVFDVGHQFVGIHRFVPQIQRLLTSAGNSWVGVHSYRNESP